MSIAFKLFANFLIIIVASYVAPNSVTQWCSVFFVGMWNYIWSMRPIPFYIAPRNGSQGALAHLQPIKPETLKWTPSLLDKCTFFFFVHYTAHRTNSIMFYSKSQANQVEVFCLRTHSVTIGTLTQTLLIRNTRVWVRCSWLLGLDTPHLEL